jgi:hypothetical protein
MPVGLLSIKSLTASAMPAEVVSIALSVEHMPAILPTIVLPLKIKRELGTLQYRMKEIRPKSDTIADVNASGLWAGQLRPRRKKRLWPGPH